MPTSPSPNELIHYGVKGMRWGFRTRDNGTVVRSGKSVKGSEDHETAKALKTKKVSSMSNAELRTLNERMQLEQTYSQLTQKTATTSKGKDYVDRGLKTTKTILDVYNTVNSVVTTASKIKKQLG